MPHIFNTLPQSLFFSQVVQTMGSIAKFIILFVYPKSNQYSFINIKFSNIPIEIVSNKEFYKIIKPHFSVLHLASNYLHLDSCFSRCKLLIR